VNPKQSQNLILVSGGYQIGKINERHPKCEDAYFITENAFGVSDGVSGWNDYGFSSDEFSKQLMQNAKLIIEKKLKQEKKTTFEKVKIIFNKTRSVLSLKNFGEPKENWQPLKKN
jgi:serine/threonine protein phosphatase PrpC